MNDSLILRRVSPMGTGLVDLAIRDGLIERLGPELPNPGELPEIDGAGQLLLPGFVEGHCHLDKTFWGLPWRPHQAGPTVRDRIDHERRLRRELALDPKPQALALLRQMVSNGSTGIRSHVDIDPDTGLAGMEALLALRERYRDRLTLQLVAFPQSGLVREPGVADLLEAAVQLGADAVGGLDPMGIDRDPAAQLDTVFAIAARHGVGVDIHLHDPGELGAVQLEMVIERTRALGLTGRVAVSHGFCLGMVPEARLRGLAEQLADLRISIMTHGPGPTPMPPVQTLHEAGVNLFSGSDAIRDAWTPFGNGDMLERAWLIAYRQGFRTDPGLILALRLATVGGAVALGLKDYGLEPGCRADLLLLAAENLAEAVVNRPARSLVLGAGRVLVRDGACVI